MKEISFISRPMTVTMYSLLKSKIYIIYIILFVIIFYILSCCSSFGRLAKNDAMFTSLSRQPLIACLTSGNGLATLIITDKY